MKNRANIKEHLGKALFGMAALICITAVVAIFAFLILKSVPAFQKLGFFRFIFSDTWAPDRTDTFGAEQVLGSYGIFSMIIGSLAATVGALLFGGVLGFFTAVFLTFFCPRKCKAFFTLAIDLLAGIPSVVYGFFGIVFLLPKLSLIAPNNGSGLLATAMILGLMMLPTVVSLCKTSLEAVPIAYYEGAVALGASHHEAAFQITVPAARSGIFAALILGAGRALGETMAVVMVAGNAPTYPTGLFNSFRVLTANIVMEMGYAGEVQEGALIATGVILLLLISLIDLAFHLISSGAIRRLVKGKTGKRQFGTPGHTGLLSTLSGRVPFAAIGKGGAILAGCISLGSLLLLLGFIFLKGVPVLFQKPHLLFGRYEFGSDAITVWPSIVTTLMSVLLSLVIALPIGVMTAIFLHEYTKKKSPFVRILRYAIDILAGVPSIVYGLFGMITFVKLFGGSSSILAGSLTVSIMLLPTIVRTTEESLDAVPDSLREGSLALGAGKLRTVGKIVLPSALPGILSAAILSMGRVISESAPFLYTAGSVISAAPTSYRDSGATLAVALYQLSGEGWYMQEAYGTAVILIALVLSLDLLAVWIGKRLQARLKGV